MHTAAAMRAGATREEIAEALGTAAAVNADAAIVYTTRALDAYARKSRRMTTGRRGMPPSITVEMAKALSLYMVKAIMKRPDRQGHRSRKDESLAIRRLA